MCSIIKYLIHIESKDSDNYAFIGHDPFNMIYEITDKHKHFRINLVLPTNYESNLSVIQ